MSKRPPSSPLPEKTGIKRANMDPFAENEGKKDETNLTLHKVIQGLSQTVTEDKLPAIALWTIVGFAPAGAPVRAISSPEECVELIKGDVEFAQALQTAMTEGCYDKVMFYSIHIQNNLGPDETGIPESSSGDLTASFHAFTTNYEPGFPEALLKIIDNYHGRTEYNQAISIIQSSGVGKSRGVEEAAQVRFTFLFNLRQDLEYESYPPPDVTIRNYLTVVLSDNEFRRRCLILFFNLFIKAQTLLSKVDRKGIPIVRWWYNYLNHGASMTKPGSQQVSFYDKVVEAAKMQTLQNANVSIAELEKALKQCCDEFVAYLREEYARDNPSNIPVVLCILAFDEAQELTEEPKNHQDRSNYHNLETVLKTIATCPIFSVFLSTNSNLRSLAPPVKLHPSLHQKPNPPYVCPPITELPFDVFATGLSTHTLSKACSENVMAHFGRSLWYSLLYHGYNSVIDLAKAKLNPCSFFSQDEDAKLACLAIRISLDFDASHETARKKEIKLVASYMRVHQQNSPFT